MINMVKLSTWGDINKSLFKRHIPQIISARELLVFRARAPRTIEDINVNKTEQAYPKDQKKNGE
jgi:hypothetical protein